MRLLKGLALPHVVAAFAVLALFVAVFLQSSIHEDAYITFRVVDNFLKGYGLRWNIDERVQVYTHPLWMLLHIPLEYALHNIYYVSLLLSWTCTAGTIWIFWRLHNGQLVKWAAMFVLPFIFSKTLVNYSTSGFENPLLHLLFAAFVWTYLRVPDSRRWFYLSLLTGLSLTTRLDTICFYAPVWLLLFLRHRPKRLPLALGAVPMLAWYAFNLFYYGFLFPNTKYAKLNTGIDQAEYTSLGLHYLLNLLTADMFSALYLLLAAGLLPLLIRNRKTGEEYWRLAIVSGIVCYTAYIVYIGGTYLTGRFLSLPVLAALYVVSLQDMGCRISKKGTWRLGILLAMGVMLRVTYPNDIMVRSYCEPCFRGVMMSMREEKILLQRVLTGKETLPRAESFNDSRDIVLSGSIGRWGYRMPRHTKIIDKIAISEPLLARLPTRHRRIATTGILIRNLPKGYLHAVKTGSTKRMHPALRQYYEKLHLIVAGDFWSAERLLEIYRFNTGKYEYLRQRYVDDRKARQAMSRRKKP